MAGFSVFYSWQSDSPRKVGRDFIHGAAELAISRIAAEAVVEEAPRLEHDTEGIAGVPAVGDTIFRRIDQCGIFLADVTLLGKTRRKDRMTKKMPNPNVLLELGYAVGRIGWPRIILVMDAAFGEAQDLPFDLRFRRFPIRYRVADDRHDLRDQQERVSNEIQHAITVMEREEHQAVTDAVAKLDGHAVHFVRTNSDKSHFWQTKVGESSLPGQVDFVIRWLLELGIIECISFANDVGFAYRWTYFGRLCIRRLGLPVAETVVYSIDEVTIPQVVTDTSAYDTLLVQQHDEAPLSEVQNEGPTTTSGG